MKKHYLTALAALLTACHSLPAQTPAAAPQTIGYEVCNDIATEHLRTVLSKTATVKVCINDKEHALTADETETLLDLLVNVQSDAPKCPPTNCFYLNLQAANGEWLASLPVQNTQEGIVLLYLKLPGNNAAAPLQTWWQGISNRLSL